MSSIKSSYNRDYAIALLELLPKGWLSKSGMILGSVYGVPAILFCYKRRRIRVLLTADRPQTGRPEEPFVINFVLCDEGGDE